MTATKAKERGLTVADERRCAHADGTVRLVQLDAGGYVLLAVTADGTSELSRNWTTRFAYRALVHALCGEHEQCEHVRDSYARSADSLAVL